MEVVQVDQRRFSFWEFASNLAMAAVLGYVTWRVVGVIKTSLFSDSISLPAVFVDAPSVDDHLPDGFESEGFDLAQSRFVAETPNGFRYWLLASSEDSEQICLYVHLRSGESERDCKSLAAYGSVGLTVSFAESDEAPGESRFGGAGRYITDEMTLREVPASTTTVGLFSYVEGEAGASKDDVASLIGAELEGGRSFDEPEEADS